MKKRIFCIILVLMIVILSGCSDSYFSPARFIFDRDYSEKLVKQISDYGQLCLDELLEDLSSPPLIDCNVGDRRFSRDGFSEKVSENYILTADWHGVVWLEKYPEDRKKDDFYTEEMVLNGQFVYANYNDIAIAFCEKKENGSWLFLSYEFETGDVRYHATLEELYSFFDLDKSKWFQCFNVQVLEEERYPYRSN